LIFSEEEPKADIIKEVQATPAPVRKPKRKRKGAAKRKPAKKILKPSTVVVKPKKAPKAVKPKKALIKRGPRTNKKVGIANTGNNCFMNAIWQALR